MVRHYFEIAKAMLTDPSQRLQYKHYMDKAGMQRFLGFKHYVGVTILFYGAFFYMTSRDSPTMRYRVSVSRRVSRLTGYLTTMPLPPGLRALMYKAFGSVYGVKFDEIQVESLNSFRSFN